MLWALHPRDAMVLHRSRKEGKNTRSLHFGSKAQMNGDSRNNGSEDPHAVVVFWGPSHGFGASCAENGAKTDHPGSLTPRQSMRSLGLLIQCLYTCRRIFNSRGEFQQAKFTELWPEQPPANMDDIELWAGLETS